MSVLCSKRIYFNLVKLPKPGWSDPDNLLSLSTSDDRYARSNIDVGTVPTKSLFELSCNSRNLFMRPIFWGIESNLVPNRLSSSTLSTASRDSQEDRVSRKLDSILRRFNRIPEISYFFPMKTASAKRVSIKEILLPEIFRY